VQQTQILHLMASSMEVFLIYPVFIGIAIAVAELARQRGYSGRWWFVIALILPIISIFILLLFPSKTPRKKHINPKWKNTPTTDKVIFRK
jgi:hypothetical protein